jgi:hypothetical protein
MVCPRSEARFCRGCKTFPQIILPDFLVVSEKIRIFAAEIKINNIMKK